MGFFVASRHKCNIENPAVVWTTHHDCVPSGGLTWLRSLKVVGMEYDEDGAIKTIDGGGE